MTQTYHYSLSQNGSDCAVGKVSVAAKLSRHTGCNWRKLDCFALVYLIRGQGRYRNERKEAFSLQAGSLFLLFPGIRHAYGPTKRETWDELYILFEGPLFELWLKKGILSVKKILFQLQPIPHWLQRIESIWENASSSLEEICHLQLLLADILKNDAPSSGTAQPQVWLRNAQSTLEEFTCERDGLHLAAQKLGMSYESFRKRFRALQGIPPNHYMETCRIRKASKKLLMESTSIKELALTMGYCDEFHFSKRFKQFMGVTPSVYRNRWPRKVETIGKKRIPY